MNLDDILAQCRRFGFSADEVREVERRGLHAYEGYLDAHVTDRSTAHEAGKVLEGAREQQRKAAHAYMCSVVDAVQIPAKYRAADEAPR